VPVAKAGTAASDSFFARFDSLQFVAGVEKTIAWRPGRSGNTSWNLMRCLGFGGG
jgi:hypothetical protein